MSVFESIYNTKKELLLELCRVAGISNKNESKADIIAKLKLMPDDFIDGAETEPINDGFGQLLIAKSTSPPVIPGTHRWIKDYYGIERDECFLFGSRWHDIPLDNEKDRYLKITHISKM